MTFLCIVYPAILLNWSLVPGIFCIFFSIFFISIHVTWKRRQFYAFLPNLYRFYFLFLPYCISKDFQYDVGKDGKKGHPCLILDLNCKASSFLPWSFMVDILYIFFIKLRKFYSICSLLGGFNMNEYWILSNYYFSHLLLWCDFSFLMHYCNILIGFQKLNEPCIPGINPTWLWFTVLFIHFWVWFINIYLRIFASAFMENIDL